MKRLPRDPKQSGALDLFAALARSEGYTLSDPESQQRFLDAVAASLNEQKANSIRLHGHRAEAMFAYVAAALGRCAAVKQEDAGELYVPDHDMAIPDYRVVLADGEELLVEVKNRHYEDPSTPAKFTAEYVDKLRRYATLFRRPLWIAVYWSAWRLWTLLPIERLPRRGEGYAVTLLEAMKANEMYRLGDCDLGTRPELRLRLGADPKKPRQLDAEGRFAFTVGTAEMCCGGVQVPAGREANLALTLMLFGSWPVSGPRPLGEGEDYTGIEFVAAPVDYEPAQGFASVGFASAIVARQFDQVTVGEEGIVRVSPGGDPWGLGDLLGSDFKSDALPLWRFYIHPKHVTGIHASSTLNEV